MVYRELIDDCEIDEKTKRTPHLDSLAIAESVFVLSSKAQA
jgi:hypothetical protein